MTDMSLKPAYDGQKDSQDSRDSVGGAGSQLYQWISSTV